MDLNFDVLVDFFACHLAFLSIYYFLFSTYYYLFS